MAGQYLTPDGSLDNTLGFGNQYQDGEGGYLNDLRDAAILSAAIEETASASETTDASIFTSTVEVVSATETTFAIVISVPETAESLTASATTNGIVIAGVRIIQRIAPDGSLDNALGNSYQYQTDAGDYVFDTEGVSVVFAATVESLNAVSTQDAIIGLTTTAAITEALSTSDTTSAVAGPEVIETLTATETISSFIVRSATQIEFVTASDAQTGLFDARVYLSWADLILPLVVPPGTSTLENVKFREKVSRYPRRFKVPPYSRRERVTK